MTFASLQVQSIWYNSMSGLCGPFSSPFVLCFRLELKMTNQKHSNFLDTRLSSASEAYSETFDAFYDPDKNEWLDSKCDDPTCEFCTTRPEKPLDDHLDDILMRSVLRSARVFDKCKLEQLKEYDWGTAIKKINRNNTMKCNIIQIARYIDRGSCISKGKTSVSKF